MLLSRHGSNMRVYDVKQKVDVRRLKYDFDRLFTCTPKPAISRRRILHDHDLEDREIVKTLIATFVDLSKIDIEKNRIDIDFHRKYSFEEVEQDAIFTLVSGILCVARRNAEGGKERFMNERDAVYDREIKPGQMIVLDRNIKHHMTPVTGMEPRYEGHVDSVIMTCFTL